MSIRPKPSPRMRQDSRNEVYEMEPKPSHKKSHFAHLAHTPGYNHNGHKVTKNINPDGESGRRGFSPLHFFKIIWRSSCTASKWVNVLWPFVPAAIALHFAAPEQHLWIFILSYIGMVPSANLIGFAGQELARKLPKVFGVLLETTLGSLVEMVLFMVLLVTQRDAGVRIIRAAIMGSILANLLLCLGVCFFVGGLKRHEQSFHEAVSETGSNLMLVAGMALVIPTAYSTAIAGGEGVPTDLTADINRISRATAIILLTAFFMYTYYQASSHHGLFDAIFEEDEARDRDRDRDLSKNKLTFTEAVIALALAITFVSMMAVFLVLEIEPIVHERHISDAFMGLILVPLVEKAAEHLTAVDEAYDDQMNFALSHVLGASIQTALLNTPLVVIVGWGLDINMSLDFELFESVVLILAILVVGGFLRDGKSNYLEGGLCVLVYVLIAVTAFYYPDPVVGESTTSEATAGVTAEHRRWIR